MGASVFGPNEVYAGLRAFKTHLLASNANKLYASFFRCGDCITEHIARPKLYFVKMDVQACFDTIEQDKLLMILKTLISEVTDLFRASIVIGVHRGLSGYLYYPTIRTS